MKRLPGKNEMERALRRRDRTYDGVFYVGVRSTGVFCRPSCPARKPKPRNIEFFATPQEAIRGGYRACLRCRPLEPLGREPEWVARLLGEMVRRPDERLADPDIAAMGIHPARARRYFQENYGMTFQAYQRTARMGLALGHLRNGRGSVRAGLETGFGSDSGFRDAFRRTFGKPPGAGEAIQPIVTARLDSPIGPLLAGATEDGVCLLEFADRRAFETQVKTLQDRLGSKAVPGRNELLDRLADQLQAYFAGKLTCFDLPLVAPGTVFQRQVWERLLRIPFGQTVSYLRLAKEVGRPGAQRAVGQANGKNRIAIVIPCHRVVQSDGKLRGYGGGPWRKQFLLDLERDVLERLSPVATL